ncbi:hypothetical protein RM553_16365 [Zunongwangia sp. F363]|uniref:Adhesin domain-containing protein n=1 Tax=Autumnicola tepida TaxID=3075595 RepID=A0ABU3CDL1_9FLAO|nr:hypothetical protein [Zunongwangia sp. F363]MDT0644414.1 hypothetical protein [Zunongwangia sp. F363]
MKTYRLNILLMLLLLTAGLQAQTKKLEKSFNTSGTVNVNVDAKHTNISIEKWDRNEVKVEAYLNSETSDKKQVQEMLNSWKLEASGSSNDVSIISGGNANWNPEVNMDIDMSSLNESLGGLQELLGPMMENLMPMIQNIASNPLPENFTAKVGDMNFDYEAYQRNPDEYMEKWEAQVEEKFGKDFEKDMEKWAAQIEKNSEKWEKEYGAKMEAWGEEFGEDMEAWGEQFGKEMEKWGEQFGKEMEAKFAGKDAKVFMLPGAPARANRSIKISVPKNAQLNLNVRHGELKLSGTTSNVKAKVSHGSLHANRLTGNKTDVNVSYSPVKIKQWDYGVLTAGYVQDLEIEKAVSIKLNSNSSNVLIGEIGETGILNGSFGELGIMKLAPGFKTLRISLENSDLELSLPDTAFTFSYDGTQSDIDYPSGMQLKTTKTYDNVLLNGYNKSKDGAASVNIKASFSDVLVK